MNGASVSAAIDRFLEITGHLTEATVHRDEANRLHRVSLPKCGNCNKWMKSSQCPREHNVNGMTRGPSSEEIACKQYVEGSTVQIFRDLSAAEMMKAEAALRKAEGRPDEQPDAEGGGTHAT